MSAPPAGTRSPYRLDELGWLQFDRLCELLFATETGVDDVNWHGQSDSWRAATVSGPLVLHDRGVRLHGPVTVVAFWIPDDALTGARLSELAGRVMNLLGDSGSAVANELLVFTNLDTERAGAALRAEAFVGRRRIVVMGASQIAASLDRHPELRAALPSVLGLRDLGSLIDCDLRDRSAFDVARAQDLARVFWPTRAYERSRTVLGKHGFVVLTGPPEMGKTAIARTLALAQMTAGWEAHECTDPDQVSRAFDGDRRQVFAADDAFGSTEYRPDSAERWALALGRLLRLLDEDHWLIWTSRPAPLKAGLRRVRRERGSERFPSPGQVLVDASDLDLEDKTLILFGHAKAHGIDGAARSLLQTAGASIVEHPHFTPERIRRFVSDRVDELPELAAGDGTRLRLTIERELAAPTEAMRNSFQALAPEHRDLLIAMLDAPAGLIDERTLAATVRRHHSGGLSSSPGDLIDRLTDHFLRLATLGIGWVHPSWRDLVIDQLRADPPARRRFLSVCGVDGVMLALSQQGGGRGDRRLPLLEDDADWDLLGDRVHELPDQLESRDLARVILALEAALTDLEDPRQRLEAHSVAVHLLNTTRQTWNGGDQALPSFLLDAWYRLRQHAGGEIEPPQLLATWVELHPGALLLEQPDRDGLLRADEWLAVAQILNEYSPSTLAALGFFERDRGLLVELVLTLTRTEGPHAAAREIAESVLTRIGSLMPELAGTTRYAISVGGWVEALDRKRWWVPHDIAAPPSAERVAARIDFTREDVERVLSDL